METTDVNSAGNNGNDNTDETQRPPKVYVGYYERYRRNAPTIYHPPYEAVRSVEP